MRFLQIPKSDSCLLVIDMQNGFVDAESEMGKSPSGTAKQRAIVPALRRLVELFHRERIPVVWSQQEHFPEDKTRLGRLIRPHSLKQGFLPCLRGTSETAIFAPLRDLVKPEDHLVQKHRASVFFNTNLETKLRMLGTKFLFIAGCNTEFCVESTVRDAYARDFQIIVVADCVAGIREEFHESSLRVMAAYFAEVLPLETLEEMLT